MTRDRLVFSLTVAVCGAAMLLPALWPRPWAIDQMAELGATSPGCVGDLLTGVLDCFNVLDDGSWIRRRGY